MTNREQLLEDMIAKANAAYDMAAKAKNVDGMTLALDLLFRAFAETKPLDGYVQVPAVPGTSCLPPYHTSYSTSCATACATNPSSAGTSALHEATPGMVTSGLSQNMGLCTCSDAECYYCSQAREHAP